MKYVKLKLNDKSFIPTSASTMKFKLERWTKMKNVIWIYKTGDVVNLLNKNDLNDTYALQVISKFPRKIPILKL